MPILSRTGVNIQTVTKGGTEITTVLKNDVVIYCKRKFTITKKTTFLVVGFTAEMEVTVNEPLPVDVDIGFQYIILGEIRAIHVQTLKAGETKVSDSTFQVGGVWAGIVVMDKWYDGSLIRISSEEQSPSNSTWLY